MIKNKEREKTHFYIFLGIILIIVFALLILIFFLLLNKNKDNKTQSQNLFNKLIEISNKIDDSYNNFSKIVSLKYEEEINKFSYFVSSDSNIGMQIEINLPKDKDLIYLLSINRPDSLDYFYYTSNIEIVSNYKGFNNIPNNLINIICTQSYTNNNGVKTIDITYSTSDKLVYSLNNFIINNEDTFSFSTAPFVVFDKTKDNILTSLADILIKQS